MPQFGAYLTIVIYDHKTFIVQVFLANIVKCFPRSNSLAYITSGVYYKHMIIVNDDSSIVSEQSF
jgi:hypothetical protein